MNELERWTEEFKSGLHFSVDDNLLNKYARMTQSFYVTSDSYHTLKNILLTLFNQLKSDCGSEPPFESLPKFNQILKDVKKNDFIDDFETYFYKKLDCNNNLIRNIDADFFKNEVSEFLKSFYVKRPVDVVYNRSFRTVKEQANVFVGKNFSIKPNIYMFNEQQDELCVEIKCFGGFNRITKDKAGFIWDSISTTIELNRGGRLFDYVKRGVPEPIYLQTGRQTYDAKACHNVKPLVMLNLDDNLTSKLKELDDLITYFLSDEETLKKKVAEIIMCTMHWFNKSYSTKLQYESVVYLGICFDILSGSSGDVPEIKEMVAKSYKGVCDNPIVSQKKGKIEFCGCGSCKNVFSIIKNIYSEGRSRISHGTITNMLVDHSLNLNQGYFCMSSCMQKAMKIFNENDFLELEWTNKTIKKFMTLK